MSAPQAPKNVTASDGTYADKVTITWTASSGARGYEVWRGTTSSSTASTTVKISTTTTKTTYDDASAARCTTYYYWVKATNAGGASPFSAPADAGYRKLTTPDTPQSVNASDGTYSDKVRITWTAAACASGYEVRRGTSSNSSSSTKIGSTTSPTFDDTTATPGKSYYYWVDATNAAGKSGSINAQDTGYRNFAPPSNVKATDGAYVDKVVVNWTAVVGATGYEVWRGTAASSSSAALIGTTSSAAYDDKTAEAATTYYYWAKAKNAVAVSSLSTPPDSGCRLSTPTSVKATDGTYASRVQVTWNSALGALGYQVWRSSSSSVASATQIGSATTTSYDDKTAAVGSTYYYWIKATNGSASTTSSPDTGWRKLLQEGDILLYQGTNWISDAIRKADAQQINSGVYSHAAIYVGKPDPDGVEKVVEMLKDGCTKRALSASIAGAVHVDAFRRNGVEDAQGPTIASKALSYYAAATPYAFTQIAVFASFADFILHTITQPDLTLVPLADADAGGRRKMICSELVAWAYYDAKMPIEMYQWWPSMRSPTDIITTLNRQMDYTSPNMLALAKNTFKVGGLK